MENSLTNQYVPPIVEVNSIELESNIALQSPVINVNANNWAPDEEIRPDTGDIYLPI